MRTAVVLQLALYGLCLTLTLIEEGMGVDLPDPPGVNCRWGPWSEWSPCDPCTKTRRHSRTIEAFGQFGGQTCQGSLGEREFCTTQVNCNNTVYPVCSDTEFKCGSGSCIKKRLKCNGDFDCEDGSDEDCDPEHPPCRTRVLDSNEQARTAGYGSSDHVHFCAPVTNGGRLGVHTKKTPPYTNRDLPIVHYWHKPIRGNECVGTGRRKNTFDFLTPPRGRGLVPLTNNKINILGADPRMNPFNNDFFNGQCKTVQNPTTGKDDRIPWNVGVLQYQTLAEETFSREIYENTHSLLREILREMNNKVEAGLNFKFSPSEKSLSSSSSSDAPSSDSSSSSASISGSVGLEGSYEKKTMIKDITEYTTIKNKSFMRVKGRVQLSTYRMRSQQLQVADDFVQHVKSLPMEYEKGIYFAFLEDYGTHYTKNGKTGGEYELIYVLNEDSVRQRNLTERQLQECVKAGIKADIAETVDGHVSRDGCDGVTTKNEGSTQGKAVVDKVMTSVKGGNLESAVAMRAKLNKDGVMDIDTIQNWARTIPIVPALINSESEPIYMLIPLDMPGANTKISNMKQAIDDYIAEYSVCKCKPCHNGGTLTLLDGKCLCLCSNLYEGQACQNFKGKNAGSKPDINQEGNWTCWSSWSACSGQKRTRSRGCNTEGLHDATCRGDSRSEEFC